MASTNPAASTMPDPYDAETVAGYDALNPDGPDHDYFRSLATGARRVSDLGCGTGILTVTLAEPGRSVTGIDPSAAMIRYAAARPGGDEVEWRHGTSELLPPHQDLVVMTGNVAMHIIGADWPTTLADIYRSLRPGGRVAFETRNPDAEAWRGWNEPPFEREVGGRQVVETLTTDAPDAQGVVVMRSKRTDVCTGETCGTEQHLQFRSLAQVTADLAAAGLRVQHVWQSWAREPGDLRTNPALLIIEAERPDEPKVHAPRSFGILRLSVPEDFDDPLPEDEVQLWE